MLSSILGNTNTTMVGIDIGSHAVKAVLLERDGEQYRLLHAIQEPIPKGIMSDREVQDIEAISKVLGKIRNVLPRAVKLAASAVSGSTVITKTIYMDANIDDDDMEYQIEIEADNLIPYPLEEVSLDFEVLGSNQVDPAKVDVLLSAARTDNIQGRVQAIESAGFKAKVIDVESYALSRAVDLIRYQLPDDSLNKVVGIIDMGANMTLMTAVLNETVIYTRDQVFGGEQYTKNIANFYNKTFDEAEVSKKLGDLPPNYMFEVLAPFQTAVIQQIRRAVQMFITSTEHEKLEYLVLSGGTANLEGVRQVIEDELGIKTIIANPFQKMDIDPNLDVNALDKQASTYMIAAGLALRSFNPCHI